LFGLLQNQASVVNDRARNIMGAMVPVLKGKAYVELPNNQATVSFYGDNPVFYLQLSQPSAAGVAIVRTKPRNGGRVIGEIAINSLTKSETESQDTIAVAQEQLQAGSALAPAVIRLSAKEPLKPGEYAVVEYAEKGKMNLFVWDFGYHPETNGKKKK